MFGRAATRRTDDVQGDPDGGWRPTHNPHLEPHALFGATPTSVGAPRCLEPTLGEKYEIVELPGLSSLSQSSLISRLEFFEASISGKFRVYLDFHSEMFSCGACVGTGVRAVQMILDHR